MRQTRPASRRPALVSFAAILLIWLGGAELILAITEFFRDELDALPPLAGNYNILWGGVDVLGALVLLYAGYALLQAQAVGRVIALLVAVLTAFRWATYVWYIPLAAALVVVICGLIIYTLAASDNYFSHS
ncbi:MAG TPA: hypothetical protein VH349_04020 [Ktedonobacterales bacterium]|jgi:hypothetical protein